MEVTMTGHLEFSTNLPAGVAEYLGWYVYLYVDPRNEKIFYVGKGKGKRILAHFDDPRDSDKTRTISELAAAGLRPRLDMLAHGLKDEETAFRIEAAVIDVLRLGELTNAVRGWKSLQLGRMTLEELVGYYAAKPITITHPVLLIRINKLYRHNMLPLELQEATRGIWKVGPRRSGAKYAFAVFEGVVREVYEVRRWHPARTLPYKTRDLSARDARGRWEFDGVVADSAIRDMYRGRSVQSYLKHGNQSPTVYVNC
jgi:hypothetical protein